MPLAITDWDFARADGILLGLNYNGLDILRKCIAEAIAGERERCAQIAEAEPEMPDEPEPHVVEAMEKVGAIENARAAVRATKKSIARTIRSGLHS